MKTFKKLLWIVAVLVALVLIVGLFLPKQASLERSKIIDAPIEMVYDQVNNLYNWMGWSPWHKLDPKMELTYHNGGIGQGAGYSWISDQKSVGSGSLTLVYSHPFDTIKTAMDFGPHGTAYSNYYFRQTETGVELTWTFSSDMGKNPIGRWMGMLMKGVIAKSYDEGLANIDSVCQQLKMSDWYYVKVKTKPAVKYYGLTAEVEMDKMEQTIGEFYRKLHEDMAKNFIEASGAPFTLYHTWGETVKFECCVMVADNSKELKGIEAKELPEAKYAVIKYTGAYEDLAKPHQYMDHWLELTGKQVVGAVRESYKTDPTQEPDPNKWITYVMYPIQ
jgi:effector-binding domain-containing protein